MKFKHPKTFHFLDSPGVNKDDKILKSVDHFTQMKSVIASIKLDGESFTGYASGKTHARSIDSNNHESRNWAKNFWSNVYFELPENWRVTCENMYALHTIPYSNLESYLYGIVIWNENNIALCWEQTKLWFGLLGIPTVPVFYEGKFKYKKIHEEFLKVSSDQETEGFVVRNSESFSWKDYSFNVGKWVRKNHVQENDDHWLNKPVIPNKLKVNL